MITNIKTFIDHRVMRCHFCCMKPGAEDQLHDARWGIEIGDYRINLCWEHFTDYYYTFTAMHPHEIIEYVRPYIAAHRKKAVAEFNED